MTRVGVYAAEVTTTAYFGIDSSGHSASAAGLVEGRDLVRAGVRAGGPPARLVAAAPAMRRVPDRRSPALREGALPLVLPHRRGWAPGPQRAEERQLVAGHLQGFGLSGGEAVAGQAGGTSQHLRAPRARAAAKAQGKRAGASARQRTPREDATPSTARVCARSPGRRTPPTWTSAAHCCSSGQPRRRRHERRAVLRLRAAGAQRLALHRRRDVARMIAANGLGLVLEEHRTTTTRR